MTRALESHVCSSMQRAPGRGPRGSPAVIGPSETCLGAGLYWPPHLGTGFTWSQDEGLGFGWMATIPGQWKDWAECSSTGRFPPHSSCPVTVTHSPPLVPFTPLPPEPRLHPAWQPRGVLSTEKREHTQRRAGLTEMACGRDSALGTPAPSVPPTPPCPRLGFLLMWEHCGVPAPNVPLGLPTCNSASLPPSTPSSLAWSGCPRSDFFLVAPS